MRLTVFVSLVWVGVVSGSYLVEVRVHSYRNPSGRCDACRAPDNPVPGCCDEVSIRPLDEECPENCDTSVDICLRALRATGISCEPDQLFMADGVGVNTNSFNFGSGFFGFPNPGTISGTQAWVGVQILFIFLDCNNVGGICDFIDSFPVDIRIAVGTASPETEYIGNAGLARLNISFEVRCSENFFGRDCLTNCSDFQSCAGCGLSGFTGEFCQYTIGSCSRLYCSGNGTCLEGDSACVCDMGYTGDFCQHIDDCDGVSCNNGECVDEINGFVCNCETGFTGDICQLNIDDCDGVSCNNNGECIDGTNAFTCNCEPGFTGDLCEFNIDDCEDVDCNNGECEDGINGFTCECTAGFTGEMCDEADQCLNVTCSQNGLCVNSPEQFTCLCNTGFGGDLCQEEVSSASSANVGGIAGGVIGALIGAILVAIGVVVVVIVLSRVRRSRSHSTVNGLKQSPSDIFPGDNPAYGARSTVNGVYRVSPPNATVNSPPPNEATNSRTEHSASMSMRERDFDNPIYSQDDIMTENPYTMVDSETSTENRYAVPSSIPAGTGDEDLYAIPDSPPNNIYERVPGDGIEEGAAAIGYPGVYYSVIKT